MLRQDQKRIAELTIILAKNQIDRSKAARTSLEKLQAKHTATYGGGSEELYAAQKALNTHLLWLQGTIDENQLFL